MDECKPIVGYWLLGISSLIAGIVTVGGITRLTRSGLSMTDWKLQGSFPPMTTAEWNAEFERYKTFPEWQQRQSMTVDEFKSIYYWEYGHRMMGRFIGFAFVVPGAIFAAKGMIPRSLLPRLALLFGLGGGQGLIGWWMVKSGLEVDPQQRHEIRVSPYRLATHLTMAFTTYTATLWTALDILNPAAKLRDAAAKMTPEMLAFARRSRRFSIHNLALLATTVVSGAFVAGIDAGLAFNTFPKMGDNWIPEGLLNLAPAWRNFFENTATVQLDHRVLAISTLTAITAAQVMARRAVHGQYWKALPSQVRTAYNAVAAMAVTQVGLGISTLLLYVPIPLAAAHQAGSLALLTLLTVLVHSLRFATPAAAATGSLGKASMALLRSFPTVRPVALHQRASGSHKKLFHSA